MRFIPFIAFLSLFLLGTSPEAIAKAPPEGPSESTFMQKVWANSTVTLGVGTSASFLINANGILSYSDHDSKTVQWGVPAWIGYSYRFNPWAAVAVRLGYAQNGISAPGEVSRHLFLHYLHGTLLFQANFLPNLTQARLNHLYLQIGAGVHGLINARISGQSGFHQAFHPIDVRAMAAVGYDFFEKPLDKVNLILGVTVEYESGLLPINRINDTWVLNQSWSGIFTIGFGPVQAQ